MRDYIGMNINQTRKANLRRIIQTETNGNIAAFAKRHDLDASYLSQLLGGHRNIGERSARNIENKAGLRHGQLDEQARELREPTVAYVVAPSDTPLEQQLIEAFHQAPPEIQAGVLTLFGIHANPHTEPPARQPKKSEPAVPANTHDKAPKD